MTRKCDLSHIYPLNDKSVINEILVQGIRSTGCDLTWRSLGFWPKSFSLAESFLTALAEPREPWRRATRTAHRVWALPGFLTLDGSWLRSSAALELPTAPHQGAAPEDTGGFGAQLQNCVTAQSGANGAGQKCPHQGPRCTSLLEALGNVTVTAEKPCSCSRWISYWRGRNLWPLPWATKLQRWVLHIQRTQTHSENLII